METWASAFTFFLEGSSRTHKHARAAAAGLLAIIVLLGGASSDLVAQVSPTAARFWASGGIGVGATDEAGGSLAVDLAYQRGPHLLSVRATGVLTLAGGDISDNVTDIGVLYGRALTRRGTAAHAAAAVGLSLTEVDLPGLPVGSRRAIGIPVGVEVSANGRLVGLGLKGFANLNSVQSFAGLVLVLKLGRLR
jgi:hypothetical protein